jgi:hypothetical protein
MEQERHTEEIQQVSAKMRGDKKTPIVCFDARWRYEADSASGRDPETVFNVNVSPHSKQRGVF